MDTKEKILEAALGLFREKGFAETTMREIAKEAGVATGLAYYYYPKKEDLVMAFYNRAREEMQPMMTAAGTQHKKLEARLRSLIEVKLQYMAPNRKFLAALMPYSADPEHRLSPFSAETASIRDQDIEHFDKAVAESEIKITADLRDQLPRILWLYQMGLVLFWLYDRSDGAARTQLLLEKSLRMIILLLKVSSLPLMKPARKMALDLVHITSQRG